MSKTEKEKKNIRYLRIGGGNFRLLVSEMKAATFMQHLRIPGYMQQKNTGFMFANTRNCCILSIQRTNIRYCIERQKNCQLQEEIIGAKRCSGQRNKEKASTVEQLAYRFQGFPTRTQEHILNQFIGSVRFLWNRMLGDWMYTVRIPSSVIVCNCIFSANFCIVPPYFRPFLPHRKRGKVPYLLIRKHRISQ